MSEGNRTRPDRTDLKHMNNEFCQIGPGTVHCSLLLTWRRDIGVLFALVFYWYLS